MSTRLYLTFVLLVVVGCGGGSQTGGQQQLVKTTVKKLTDDYENEVRGNEKYAGKKIEVRGRVTFIGSGDSGKTIIYFGQWACECSNKTGVADLNPDDWILLAGTVPHLKTTGPIPDRRLTCCQLVRKLTESEIREID